MFHPRIFLAAMMVLSLSALAIAAEPKSKAAGGLPAVSKAKPEPQPGWIIIEEETWIRLDDEPSHYMRQAHESFLKKEYEAAANELRKSGTYLYVAAQNASQGTKESLLASAHELDRLAAEVRSGTVKSAKTLEAAFARAEHALAAGNHAKVQSAIQDKDHQTAGHYLRSAVNHVEYAAKWSGHELESGAAETAKGVRMVAGKLIEGTSFAVDETGKGTVWVGDEIKRLGKLIEPHR
jgi:hypothetical protein